MLPGEEFDVAFPEAGDYTYWCGPHKGAGMVVRFTSNESKSKEGILQVTQRERFHQLRMNHLFEEPCPLYEPEWEEDYYWDCRLTYDHEEDEETQ